MHTINHIPDACKCPYCSIFFLSNCTIWAMQCKRSWIPVSCGPFESEIWENADRSSLSSQHQGLHCIRIPVSLSISLSSSFTLWMVHLAYMNEWTHNPGQFWERARRNIIKPHKQKSFLHCHLWQRSWAWQTWPGRHTDVEHTLGILNVYRV